MNLKARMVIVELCRSVVAAGSGSGARIGEFGRPPGARTPRIGRVVVKPAEFPEQVAVAAIAVPGSVVDVAVRILAFQLARFVLTPLLIRTRLLPISSVVFT